MTNDVVWRRATGEPRKGYLHLLRLPASVTIYVGHYDDDKAGTVCDRPLVNLPLTTRLRFLASAGLGEKKELGPTRISEFLFPHSSGSST